MERNFAHVFTVYRWYVHHVSIKSGTYMLIIIYASLLKWEVIR